MADVPEHGRIATAPAADAHGHSHHPISVYLKVWGYLFVLSATSYMVDYSHVQGVLRWSLILIFMMLKAGLIVAGFLHMVRSAGSRGGRECVSTCSSRWSRDHSRNKNT